MERVAILIAAPTRTWPVRLLPGVPLSIGVDSDVSVKDSLLLPVHMVVTADDEGQATVEAKGPALLNGVQLSARAQVRPGDEVAVGDTVLIFRGVSDAPAASDPVWPWEPFQWWVEEELTRGVRGSVKLSRTRPLGAGRIGGLHDRLFGAFVAGGVPRERPVSGDAFELFHHAMAELLALPPELDPDEQLTQDAVMLRLLSLGERLSSERASVLVVGERGTGKSAYARRIAPSAKPWRGESVAPTGALFIRHAERLDEAARGQLAAALRAGRQVVATAAVEDAQLSKLFAHVITVPPLRERDADVEALAEVFLGRARKALGLRKPALSAQVRQALHRARYARNLSELKWVMEVAAIVSDSEEVTLSALPESFKQGANAAGNLRVDMKHAEKQALLHALGRTRWNVSEAARLLGLPRRTVVYRMSKLGLRRPSRA